MSSVGEKSQEASKPEAEHTAVEEKKTESDSTLPSVETEAVVARTFECSKCHAQHATDEVFIWTHCGHCVSRDCAHSHVMRLLHNKSLPVCPVAHCTNVLSEADAQLLLDDGEYGYLVELTIAIHSGADLMDDAPMASSTATSSSALASASGPKEFGSGMGRVDLDGDETAAMLMAAMLSDSLGDDGTVKVEPPAEGLLTDAEYKSLGLPMDGNGTAAVLSPMKSATTAVDSTTALCTETMAPPTTKSTTEPMATETKTDDPQSADGSRDSTPLLTTSGDVITIKSIVQLPRDFAKIQSEDVGDDYDDDESSEEKKKDPFYAPKCISGATAMGMTSASASAVAAASDVVFGDYGYGTFEDGPPIEEFQVKGKGDPSKVAALLCPGGSLSRKAQAAMSHGMVSSPGSSGASSRLAMAGRRHAAVGAGLYTRQQALGGGRIEAMEYLCTVCGDYHSALDRFEWSVCRHQYGPQCARALVNSSLMADIAPVCVSVGCGMMLLENEARVLLFDLADYSKFLTVVCDAQRKFEEDAFGVDAPVSSVADEVATAASTVRTLNDMLSTTATGKMPTATASASVSASVTAAMESAADASSALPPAAAAGTGLMSSSATAAASTATRDLGGLCDSWYQPLKGSDPLVGGEMEDEQKYPEPVVGTSAAEDGRPDVFGGGRRYEDSGTGFVEEVEDEKVREVREMEEKKEVAECQPLLGGSRGVDAIFTKDFYCVRCQGDYHQVHRVQLSNCGHDFCIYCLKTHFLVQVQTLSIVPPTCPSCDVPINEVEMCRVLSDFMAQQEQLARGEGIPAPAPLSAYSGGCAPMAPMAPRVSGGMGGVPTSASSTFAYDGDVADHEWEDGGGGLSSMAPRPSPPGVFRRPRPVPPSEPKTMLPFVDEMKSEFTDASGVKLLHICPGACGTLVASVPTRTGLDDPCFDCPKCRKAFCLKCGEPYHPSEFSCETYMAQRMRDTQFALRKHDLDRSGGVAAIDDDVGPDLGVGVGDDALDYSSALPKRDLESGGFGGDSLDMSEDEQLQMLLSQGIIDKATFESISGCKLCPECNHRVTKTASTNVLKCYRCRCDFCSLCSQKLDKSRPLKEHFVIGHPMISASVV